MFVTDVDEEEEDEEPVHALDLRICKAAESITIFDEENVLALTASSAGPGISFLQVIFNSQLFNKKN